MTLRALTVALAVSAGAALLAPGTAEARHRHDRYCGHGYYDRSPRYSYRQDYGRHHRHHPRYHRYGGYGYHPRGYAYDDRYYAPPPRAYFHYHGRRRCSRVHVGLHFGW